MATKYILAKMVPKLNLREAWNNGTLKHKPIYDRVHSLVLDKMGGYDLCKYLASCPIVLSWAVTGSALLHVLTDSEWVPKDLDIVCYVEGDLADAAMGVYRYLHQQNDPLCKDIGFSIFRYGRIPNSICARVYNDTTHCADIIFANTPVVDTVKLFDYVICMAFCNTRHVWIPNPWDLFHGVSRGRGTSERRDKYLSRGIDLIDEGVVPERELDMDVIIMHEHIVYGPYVSSY